MVGPAFFLVAFEPTITTLPGMELTITAADLIPSDRATLVTGTTGAASLSRGQAVYVATGNVFMPASNGDTATVALAVGLVMVDSDPGQPTVVCISDPELELGATTLPEGMVGQVIMLGYTGGSLVTHDDIVESGLMVKLIGLVIAEGVMQMNLTGLVPAFPAAPAP